MVEKITPPHFFGMPKLPPELFDIYKRIGNDLRNVNRFKLSADTQKICEKYVDWHIKHNSHVIGSANVYRRARVNEIGQSKPYDIKKMGAPPNGTASSGRINPEGISYLYLADSVETAIAEVRPWKGAVISVAEFSVARDLKVVSLRHQRTNNLKDFGIDESEIIRKIIEYQMISVPINKFYFSAPAHGEDKLAYLPSQYIAEMFKGCSVDGIEYESVLNPGGVNIALFDPENAAALTVNQYRIESVSYGAKVI